MTKLSRRAFFVGSRSAMNIQAAVEDDYLDYFVLVGSPKEVLHQYTALTGRGEMPPDWSFGFWQSKISYKSAEETLEVAHRLRAEKIPCDVIHLDTDWFCRDWFCDLTFDPVRFPDPARYFAELASLGFKVSLWQLPYIPEGSALFEEFKAADGFVKTRSGEIYDVGICFTSYFKGIVGCIDYTNPAAVRIHQKWLRALFKMGARAIKTDFGEGAPADGVYHDGTPGKRIHNIYPLLYNAAVAQVTREETGYPFVWARSAWAGSQRYSVHWGGDNSPNWSNLGPQIEGGLSLGLSGFQFWSQDIGGFLGETGGHLLIRWIQLSMFFSHARIHGYGDRELYKFDPEARRIGLAYLRLRYRLLPYLLASARNSLACSLPIARALVIEHPEDPNVWNIGNQWYFGDSLLIAPILDESNRREVYLPAGRWHCWWTGRIEEGKQWITAEADLATLPIYVREGAVIPLGPEMDYVGQKAVDEVELVIAAFSREGKTSIGIPINDAEVTVDYEMKAGQHRLVVPEGSPRFRPRFLQPNLPSPELRLRRLLELEAVQIEKPA